jgi:hypothetical protein
MRAETDGLDQPLVGGRRIDGMEGGSVRADRRMKPRTLQPTDGLNPLCNSPEFSLFAGGPLFQLLFRAQRSDDELMKVRQRFIIGIALFVWLPLLVLSAVKGQLFRGSVAVPFILDLEVHVRFLAALPLLLIAELATEQRMRPLLQQFLERNLVPKNSMGGFEAAVTSASRLRNSVIPEVLLVALVYGFGILIVWRQYVALDIAAWYTAPSGEGSRLSLAGMWYGYVSLPIFQFLLLRWYFRLFIWARFLWQMSRIELNLVPTHPDRVAGLSFLSNTTNAFSVLAAAHGALLAGYLATRVVILGTTLTQFKTEIALMVIFVLCIILSPLLVFSPKLIKAKRNGLREYGVLAGHYVNEFDTKWLRGGVPTNEKFVGSADIQSLADLGNSYNMVQAMRSAPITRNVIVRLTVATLVPIVPLLLTMMSLEDLVKKLVAILLK